MTHVMARIVVKPESAEEARAILLQLVAASRREAGCVSYELFRRPDAPHVFQTFEAWSDQAAADAHMKTPHIAAAIAAAAPMFASAPEIVVFENLL
ncbi:MAG: putative quinol monooxygenase [Caldimonas sp.]